MADIVRQGQPIYPDFLQTAREGYGYGQQQQFNQLAGQYIGDPQGNSSMLGQLAALNPREAVGLQNNALAQQASQQQQQQQQQALASKKLNGAANYALAALQSNDPARIKGAGDAIGPYLTQLTGKQFTGLTPDMLPALYKVIGQTGGSPENKGVVVSAGGAVVDPTTGKQLFRNPFATKLIPNVPNGDATAAGVFDPNTATLRPAVGGQMPGQPAPGGQSAQPPAVQQPGQPPMANDAMAPFLAQANEAIKMGAPEAQVTAWLQGKAQEVTQQAQGAPAPAMGPQGASPQDAPAQFGVGAPKVPAEIQTMRQIQSDPSLMKTWRDMHPSASVDGMGRAPVGYQWNAEKSALEPIPGGPADSAGTGQGLSKDAIENAAWSYIGSGKLPAVGRGREGVAQRTAVMNQAAQIAKDAGVPASELQTVPGRNKALQASLTNLQKISDVMEKSENAFQNNTQVAMDLSSKLTRTGSPAINAWLLGAKAQMGDPDVQALDAAITTMSVDYARIMSGMTGAGGTPISTAEEAKSLIRKELSHQSLAAVVGVLNKDIAGQQSAVHDQRGKILGAMQTMHDDATPGGNPTGAAPASPGRSLADPLGILH